MDTDADPDPRFKIYDDYWMALTVCVPIKGSEHVISTIMPISNSSIHPFFSSM